MSEPMTSPNDWSQFYHQQRPPNNQTVSSDRGAPQFVDGVVSDSTAITATITSSPSSSQTTGVLSPEGRVSKPVRRRSRASRRTPTTLLNTDTTNFRAMVQQFTGGPTAPFASGLPQLNAPVGFSFGITSHQPQVNTSGAGMVPAGYQLQYHQPQRFQQNQQQSQQAYLLSLGMGNNSTTTNPGGDHLFRLGNPRPAGISDEFVLQGELSSQVPPYRPPGTSSNENRSNSFLF